MESLRMFARGLRFCRVIVPPFDCLANLFAMSPT